MNRSFLKWGKFAASLLFFSVTLVGGAVSAQDNSFNMEVKIRNYPDSLNHYLLLGRYNWNSQYIVDTAFFNPSTRSFLFHKDQRMEGGLYLLISSDKQHLIEFVLDKDQNLTIEIQHPQWNEQLQYFNSPENSVYLDFTKAGNKDYQAMNEAQKAYQQANEAKDEAGIKKAKEEITELYKKLDAYKKSFIEKYPDHLMSALFKSQEEIDVPDAPAHLSEDDQRIWQYNYYKDHFFDNFDLCDSRLLYTPVLYDKYNAFLEKVLKMQSPDTIKFALERLIEKSRCNKDVFKYFIWYPVDKFQRSEIIGQDAIWVYLAEKYYSTGEAFWASPAIIQNFNKRIQRVKPLLIGHVPPNFACPDTTVDTPHENFVFVHSSPQKYTIVIFWSMDCGHCKKVMPKWLDFYHRKKQELDLEVIAICKDFDKDKWLDYIRKNKFDWINLNGKTATADYNDLWDIQSTPVVYILDRDKRIVTKRIDPDYAEDFIKMWEELYYKK